MKLFFKILHFLLILILGQTCQIYGNTTNGICFFEKYSSVAIQENKNREWFSKNETDRICNFEWNLLSYWESGSRSLIKAGVDIQTG